MSKHSKIKLLIVDDHPALRKGLREVEEICPEIEVVGEAGSGAEALKQTALLRPNVVLLDYRLPDISGHEVCRRIKEKHPSIHMLFLSSYAAESTVHSALEAGAAGYLLKENDAQKIVDAILAVARGGKVVDPMIAHALIARDQPAGGSDFQKLSKLSVQETKVLQEVARGRTDKEVADTLGLQTKTARHYLDNIFSKLGMHTRTQAAALYLRATSEPE